MIFKNWNCGTLVPCHIALKTVGTQQAQGQPDGWLTVSFQPLVEVEGGFCSFKKDRSDRRQ